MNALRYPLCFLVRLFLKCLRKILHEIRENCFFHPVTFISNRESAQRQGAIARMTMNPKIVAFIGQCGRSNYSNLSVCHSITPNWRRFKCGSLTCVLQNRANFCSELRNPDSLPKSTPSKVLLSKFDLTHQSFDFIFGAKNWSLTIIRGK